LLQRVFSTYDDRCGLTALQLAKHVDFFNEVQDRNTLEDQLNEKSVILKAIGDADLDPSSQFPACCDTDAPGDQVAARRSPLNARSSFDLAQKQASPWTQSFGKRIFDCISVLLSLPLLIPLFLVIALALRLTSRGPVLFLQKRMGRHGQPFTILKFRTMTHLKGTAHQAVTTANNQRFTLVGPFLRRWKLDELPQLLNVLLGDMSLVGARPKLPQHQVAELASRPGITGAATIAFAREELFLTAVSEEQLDDYYRNVVLPAKYEMDAAYMAQATFFTDLKLIVNSVLRRWDPSAVAGLLKTRAWKAEDGMRRSRASSLAIAYRDPLSASQDER
jgi:lipopolysaccharide/colanic/teichoic acid biosynthesis glycosyltransferase